MTKSIFFQIPGEPRPKLRPRFSRRKCFVKTYDPQAEEKKTARWQFTARMVGQEMIESPLEIDFLFVMPIPKSTSKANRAKMLSGELKHVKKPDCDNLIKMPMDCMNGVVYADDKQAYRITGEKRYGEEPRTEITITY